MLVVSRKVPDRRVAMRLGEVIHKGVRGGRMTLSGVKSSAFVLPAAVSFRVGGGADQRRLLSTQRAFR